VEICQFFFNFRPNHVIPNHIRQNWFYTKLILEEIALYQFTLYQITFGRFIPIHFLQNHIIRNHFLRKNVVPVCTCIMNGLHILKSAKRTGIFKMHSLHGYVCVYVYTYGWGVRIMHG
jgi:hypothetical protein